MDSLMKVCDTVEGGRATKTRTSASDPPTGKRERERERKRERENERDKKATRNGMETSLSTMKPVTRL